MADKAYDIVMENRKEIVQKLIGQMEQGYASTRAAWSKAATGRHYNPVSDAVYKGGNRLRLMLAATEQGFSDPRWMTFKQASENNYRIAAGAKGVLLEKWILYKETERTGEDGKPVIGPDGKPEKEKVPLDRPRVNYFRVFNGEQILGLPELEVQTPDEDYFSRTAETFERSSKCPVLYEAQDRAYYSPAEDQIHLPPREAFKNSETRLSVLLHEMAHSTGHETRLNRDIRNKYGSMEYAKEELNAELSSVFLESELQIAMEPDSEMLKDHANYVKSWISVLRDNPNELFAACARAEGITGFLMENYEMELEKERAYVNENPVKDSLTLEERYTAAMQLAGYERTGDMEGLIAFENVQTGEKILNDGWQLVGESLEEMQPLHPCDRAVYENLVHPEGRITYCTRNLGGTGLNEDARMVMYESFGEAFDAYRDAGMTDGKTLGFCIDAEYHSSLAEFDTVSMKNRIHTGLAEPEKYELPLTVNEMDELRENMEKITEPLQRENAYIQMMDAVEGMRIQMCAELEKGNFAGLEGRFASDLRPQDYFAVTLSQEENTGNIVVEIKELYANEPAGEAVCTVTVEDVFEKGTEVLENNGIADWMKERISSMPTDFDRTGGKAFTFYSDHALPLMETHYRMLENAGYDPRVKSGDLTQEERYQKQAFQEKYDRTYAPIADDLRQSGFRPTDSLLKNIHRFECLSDRRCTLRELADLKKNPDFGRDSPKGQCFGRIVAELQEQERTRVQENDLHQQNTDLPEQVHSMKMEMMLAQMEM